MAKGIPGFLKEDGFCTVGSADSEYGKNGMFFNGREDDVGGVFTNGIGVEQPLNGTKDMCTFETPMPFCFLPSVVSAPQRIPFGVPFMNLLPYLPVAVAAVGVTLIATSKGEEDEDT